MSFFIKKVILDLGALHPQARAPRAHSVRGAATSLAFTRNAPLQEILEAATWKNSTVVPRDTKIICSGRAFVSDFFVS